jgi:hypothetical protein
LYFFSSCAIIIQELRNDEKDQDKNYFNRGFPKTSVLGIATFENSGFAGRRPKNRKSLAQNRAR